MLLALATSLQLASSWPPANAAEVYVLSPPAYVAPPYESTLVQAEAPEVVLLPDWLQRWLLLIRGQGFAIVHPTWNGRMGEGAQLWQVDLEASLKGGLGTLGPALSLQGRVDWSPWTMAGNLTGLLSGGGWFMTGDGSLIHPPFTLRLAYWESASSRGYSTLLTLRQTF